MIAAVKGWHAVVPALLFFHLPGADAADDLGGAARELARRTAGFTGRNESVSVAWRNLSSLSTLELGQARSAFEASLKEAGVHISEATPVVEAHITLSENAAQFLLVEEIRRGEDRQVWISGWKRGRPAITPASGVLLEKKLIWQQDEPMLDVALAPGKVLVLSPSKITLAVRGDLQLPSLKPLPRDPRGRLRLTGSSFQAFLPGVLCSGTIEPNLAVECRASDEMWVLESGSRALLLASFASSRNYFDGRVTMQTGQRKTVPPFYAAASVEEQGRTSWVLSGLDGRAQIYDGALDPVATISDWGSDIVGIDTRCVGGSAVLATRAGDATVPDSIQAFTVVNRSAAPLSGALNLPGPVTALWPSGGAGAVAIVRNLTTGRYEAYQLSVACGG
jgi:hypothetical protein